MTEQHTQILIIKPSSLGDVLHAFPAVTLLKKYYPNATIDWLVNPEFTKILEFHKDVDNAIIFPRKELGKLSAFPKALSSLRTQLRKKHYDLVIDLQGLMRSALAARLTRHTTIYGFATPKEKAASLLYTKRIETKPAVRHAIEKNISLINAILGTNEAPPKNTVQQIAQYADSLKEKLTEAGISSGEKCVGIVAGARWESKKWPPDFFADVIKKTSSENPDAKFIIIGAPSDTDCAQKIIDKAQNTPTVSFAGKTSIGELVELIRRCDVVVTNDSGPMHIAAALNVRTIALFGPTDPDKTGPYGSNSSVVCADSLDCLKCLKRICPLETNACHNAIDTNEVSKLIAESIV